MLQFLKKVVAFYGPTLIQTSVKSLKYRKVGIVYDQCYGTVCEVNEEQVLLYMYCKQQDGQRSYFFGLKREGLQPFKSQSCQEIDYSQSEPVQQFKIKNIQEIHHSSHFLEIFLPEDHHADFGIIFNSDALAEEWFYLLEKTKNLEIAANQPTQPVNEPAVEIVPEAEQIPNVELVILAQPMPNVEQIPVPQISANLPQPQIQETETNPRASVIDRFSIDMLIRRISDDDNLPISQQIVNYLDSIMT